MPKVIDNPVNAILNAGKEVLRSSNGSPFGMQEIAQKCSISVPSIYLRFHSFGELMGEVLILLFEEEMEGMQKTWKQSETYEEFVMGIHSFLLGFQGRYEFVLSKIKGKSKETLFGKIRSIIERNLSAPLRRFGYRMGKEDLAVMSSLLLWKSGKKGRSTVFMSKALSILNEK